MRTTPAGLLILLLAFHGAACAGGTTNQGATATPRPAAQGSANVIVESEIAGSGAANAFEVIQRLRPSMLRARNGSISESGSGVDIVIYLDGTRLGERAALTSVPVVSIREIRCINASDATTRFGTGHPLGAIVVTTKR